MTTRTTKPELKARRAELIAELFLQDLKADYVAQPTDGVGYDFLAGFTNANNGTNNFLIEVKATEKPVSKYPLQQKFYQRLAYSNVPALLLVVDVKQNQIYYGWMNPQTGKKSDNSQVFVPVTPIDDATKTELRNKLTS